MTTRQWKSERTIDREPAVQHDFIAACGPDARLELIRIAATTAGPMNIDRGGDRTYGPRCALRPLFLRQSA